MNSKLNKVAPSNGEFDEEISNEDGIPMLHSFEDTSQAVQAMLNGEMFSIYIKKAVQHSKYMYLDQTREVIYCKSHQETIKLSVSKIDEIKLGIHPKLEGKINLNGQDSYQYCVDKVLYHI